MTVGEAMRAPRRRTPHPALRGLVTDYHGYFHDSLPPGVHHGLPSSTLTVILAFDEPVDVAWQGDPGSRGQHWSMVSGLHAGPALIHHTGFQHGVQLALTPLGSRVLLGAPAAALAGELVPLAIPQAYDAMVAATTWEDRFDVLDRLLIGRAAVHDQPPIRGELQHAWRRIARSRGAVRVADLADEVGWSRRHLTERFTDEYGIGPKQAARIERFQRARDLLGSGLAVADIAARCGYADQAHLTREFRALGGCTPTQWRRESLTFVQDEAVAG
jgi:AraC-like DNA-binding protein